MTIAHYIEAREGFALGNYESLDLPIGRSYPPLQALKSLSDRLKTPFVPNAEGLPLSLRCQLALLWSIMGETEAASKLAGFLEPFLLEGFTALWTPESEYNEREAQISRALLLRATGHDVAIVPPKDPFFEYLFQQDVKIDVTDRSKIVKGPHFAFTTEGAMRIGSVQIPAFGPHAEPLSDPKSFGMAINSEGWLCANGAKETWFHLDDTFGLQCIGRPVPFVFYVRGDECAIGDRTFKPKSLQRYRGETNQVRFRNGKEIVTMAVDRPLMTELIPLAADDSFWGSAFLLAFHLSPHAGKVLFTFM